MDKDENKSVEIIKMLVDKIKTDETFKKKLLENPRQTIEEEFNIQIPKELEDQLLQSVPQLVEKINLMSGTSEAELPDLELTQISGGHTTIGRTAVDSGKALITMIVLTSQDKFLNPPAL